MVCSDALIMSITAAAIAVARGLNAEELELLAAVAVQFGDTLESLSVIRGINGNPH